MTNNRFAKLNLNRPITGSFGLAWGVWAVTIDGYTFSVINDGDLFPIEPDNIDRLEFVDPKDFAPAQVDYFADYLS